MKGDIQLSSRCGREPPSLTAKSQGGESQERMSDAGNGREDMQQLDR